VEYKVNPYDNYNGEEDYVPQYNTYRYVTQHHTGYNYKEEETKVNPYKVFQTRENYIKGENYNYFVKKIDSEHYHIILKNKIDGKVCFIFKYSYNDYETNKVYWNERYRTYLENIYESEEQITNYPNSKKIELQIKKSKSKGYKPCSNMFDTPEYFRNCYTSSKAKSNADYFCLSLISLYNLREQSIKNIEVIEKNNLIKQIEKKGLYRHASNKIASYL
jgi:hypothetical protein